MTTKDYDEQGGEMAPLTERLLHPSYVDPAQANGGYILDPVTVRRDLELAAKEIERLNAEITRRDSGAGSGGMGVAYSVGGQDHGVGSTTFLAKGGKGGGGGVGPEGMKITNLKVGSGGGQGGNTKLTPEVLEASLIHPRDVEDGHINYVVLASGYGGLYRKDNGIAMTWGGCVKMIAEQLHKWIDKDGFNVRIIAVSATRDPVERPTKGRPV